MSLEPVNLVWFKRDLRVQDHHALKMAMDRGPTIALFVVEEEWLQSDEFSNRHLLFVEDCLKELARNLKSLHVPFFILKGSLPGVFNDLQKQVKIKELFSHQETGSMWTFQRDLRVKKWCTEHAIPWSESLQFAVHRGLLNRDRWNAKRNPIVRRKLIRSVPQAEVPSMSLSLPQYHLGESSRRENGIQNGGEVAGAELLESFLSLRGENYSKEMSSPNTAFESCSRLSAHLAWGSLSLSQIEHEVSRARQELQQKEYGQRGSWPRSLRAFESRLWWHCHFIQKLERQPSLEFENVNRGYDGMRENDFDQSLFEAWAKGETGFPFIDACMRALIQEGWINFRMRAMLISFASYQLWLHWRKPAIHLAKLFTDYEPGIHFNQIQMQAGVTGINTLRIYSPIKQSKDQDPQGHFIRKYCPELSEVDDQYIHEPYLMPPMLQSLAGFRLGVDYPAPIVDHAKAYHEAKKKAFSWRKKPEVKRLAREVFQKHGSRKNQFFPAQHREAFGNLKDQKKST
ncbi:MAG: deoxyribodipyrimidine photo-lyase [Pseudomonadota bacterium]